MGMAQKNQNPFLNRWKVASTRLLMANFRFSDPENPKPWSDTDDLETRRALLKTAPDLRDAEDEQAAAFHALKTLVWPEAERLAREEGREAVRKLARYCPYAVLRAYLLDYADHVELDDGFSCDCCD